MALCWNFACIYLFYAFHFVKGSETKKLTLNATEIYKNNTIKLTCNIHEGTARSVGWYRNQGRKVISIGYVHGLCETSPPELPFSAECRCLDITLSSQVIWWRVRYDYYPGTFLRWGVSGGNCCFDNLLYEEEKTWTRTQSIVNTLERIYANNSEARRPSDEQARIGQRNGNASNGNAQEDQYYLHATDKQANEPLGNDENVYYAIGFQNASRLCRTLPALRPCTNATDEQARIGQRNGNASNGNAQEDQYYLHATDQQANEPHENDENVYYAIGFQNASRLFRTLPALRPCTNATDRFRPPDEILRPKRAIVSSGAEEPPGYEKLDDCNRTYETMYTFIKTAGMK
ncbi:hypothetical protein MAR_002702 [Mya arenaria]|uniref:Uncharacterized protein n=1 Tax=Mya arenaria TaxID=6604 RepID=A0ABY7G6Z4_MYAAR|nr:hypothetical protein MAR_002702 [Mya arenaria]